MRYRMNAPEVIAETMGGETIIVHLATGCYYNLTGSAPEIWDGLVGGESREQIVRRLDAAYEATTDVIEASVERLVRELEGEELIVGDPDGNATTARAVDSSDGPRKSFIEPALAKFTDMQDIILLDPVHEVDARGWPHQQGAG